jgi:hypothetical protein
MGTFTLSAGYTIHTITADSMAAAIRAFREQGHIAADTPAYSVAIVPTDAAVPTNRTRPIRETS